MKKKLFLITPLLLIILYLACKKTDNESPGTFKSPFIDSAVQFLKSQLDQNEFNNLDYHSIQVLKNNGRNETFKIYTTDKSDNRFIILAKPDDQFLGNWATFIYNTPNQGVIKTESFNKKLKSEFSFLNNEVVKIVKFINGETHTTLIQPRNGSLTLGKPLSSINTISVGVQRGDIDDDDSYLFLPNVTVTGYRQNTAVNFYSLYWSLNQNSSYYYSYTNNPPSGGGTTSGTSAINLPIQFAPDHPVNIAEEIKCVGASANSNVQYFVRINVNEPTPGTRSKVSMLNDHHVGHTFITLEQRNADGTIITRNVGFYPAGGVKPGVEVSPSVYGDDTSTPYCVALTISVSSQEFQTVKQFLINQTSTNYNLQTYNCSTNAVNAFSAINVQLPRTNGVILGPASMPPAPPETVELFNGLNPADLGEDIRNLDATTFSSQNGYRQVIIERYSSNSQYRARTGYCP